MLRFDKKHHRFFYLLPRHYQVKEMLSRTILKDAAGNSTATTFGSVEEVVRQKLGIEEVHTAEQRHVYPFDV